MTDETMETTTPCARCGARFSAAQLNFSDAGQVCDTCLGNAEADDMAAAAGLKAPSGQLVAAGLLSAGIINISSRSTTSSSVTVLDTVTETLNQGADVPAIAMAAFGVVLALVGAAGFARRAAGTKKLLGVVVGALIVGLAGYRITQSLPSSVVTETGPGPRCDAGDAEACNSAGVIADTAGQLPGAATRFGAACDLGNALGCRNLGYVLGRMESPDLKASLAAHSKACDLSDGRGCEAAAEVSLKLGDSAAELGFYRRACDAGYPMGCGNLGVTLTAASPTDWAAVFDAHDRGCTVGWDQSCMLLPQAWEQRTPADAAVGGEIRGRLAAACSATMPMSCTGLGVMAAQGKGGPKDDAAAVKAFETGCRAPKPHSQSCLNAGILSKDPSASRAWFQTGCDQGLAAACERLR